MAAALASADANGFPNNGTYSEVTVHIPPQTGPFTMRCGSCFERRQVYLSKGQASGKIYEQSHDACWNAQARAGGPVGSGGAERCGRAALPELPQFFRGKGLLYYGVSGKEALAAWFQEMQMPCDYITPVELEGNAGVVQKSDAADYAARHLFRRTYPASINAPIDAPRCTLMCGRMKCFEPLPDAGKELAQ